MKILFIHQNFPGQFKHIVQSLINEKEHELIAITMRDLPNIDGIRIIKYRPNRGTSQNIHPWVSDFETKIIRAEAVLRICDNLQKEGFCPDLIIAHSGWGESLFVKNVWPLTKLLTYCEFYYSKNNQDIDFDKEFSDINLDSLCNIDIKNTNNLLNFQIADAGIAPTYWQKSTFPEPFAAKISVIHEGIDTQNIRPANNVEMQINSLKLNRNDEIITFVNRNLEPYRGYHIFMRALPLIMEKRPKARILIVGGDGVSYGAKPKINKSWKQIFLDEVKDKIDLSRIHFLGNIPYHHFIALLQLSRVHVYLTYPFVLSWSLLEAMSAGCAIVASKTKPVEEVIKDNETGLLFEFFSKEEMASKIIELLENKEKREALGFNARKFIIENYDLKTKCLPQILELIKNLVK